MITIIVIVVLAVAVILNLANNNPIKNANEATFRNDVSSIQEQLDLYALSETSKTLGAYDITTMNGKVSDFLPSIKNYDTELEVQNGRLIYIGKDIEKSTIVAEIIGIDYAKYNKEKGVNLPQITEGMIPIKYESGSWVICSKEDKNWYDYENFSWANVMLSDGKYKSDTAEGTKVADNELGSMFVWIPRYAYSINQYKVAKNGEGTSQKITDVTFLVGSTNADKDGKIYATDYNTDDAVVGEATEKIVHPGFKFDGKSLTGLWSAKFEASMLEANTNTAVDNNMPNKTVKILPNTESWRYIQVGNAFANCLDMKKVGNIYKLAGADSHLMKNIEWGAVAYLSASQYGKTQTINGSGAEYETEKYHSYTGGGAYKDNVSQSSTGNVSGIYDLNGGAAEYVAAYHDNGNENLTVNGTSTYFENNKLKVEYAKYWDRYEVSENEITQMNDGLWDKDNSFNNIRMQITEDRYNLMKNKKGDAMYEVINTYSYYGKYSNGDYDWLIGGTWGFGRTFYNSDFALIGNCKFNFLRRGVNWNHWLEAGVFAFYPYNGDWSYGLGFRPVLITS